MQGTEIECISRAVLLKLERMPEKTRGLYVREYRPPHEYQYRYRVSLEDEKDLLFHRLLSSFLRDPGYLDITNFLLSHRENTWINKRPLITVFLTGKVKDPGPCLKSLADQKLRDFEIVPHNRFLREAILNSPVASHLSSVARGQYRFHLNLKDRLTPHIFSVLYREIRGKALATCGYYVCNRSMEVVREETEHISLSSCQLYSVRPYCGTGRTHVKKPLWFWRRRA